MYLAFVFVLLCTVVCICSYTSYSRSITLLIITNAKVLPVLDYRYCILLVIISYIIDKAVLEDVGQNVDLCIANQEDNTQNTKCKIRYLGVGGEWRMVSAELWTTPRQIMKLYDA